ncbi:hypothetical protein RRG08_063111 [Elysia crispata]|uniref:Uncharacterized protein n=1 Tax=Elysia crispata TaxID=231223 RepID=A0AAE1CYH9_9GAST|nr:hypothetical protein RRG08_063111 [Elysia crispata]
MIGDSCDTGQFRWFEYQLCGPKSEADSDEDAVVPAPMNPVPDTTAVYGEAQDIHPAPLSRLKLPNTTAVSVEKLKTYIQHHSADSHC